MDKVTHMDIGSETVKELKSGQKNQKDVFSFTSDIKDADLGLNKFDIIFYQIYQHIDKPALALVKFINALKNGKMYMGFYRSGEFKHFIVDAIRYLINIKLLPTIEMLILFYIR